MVGEFVVRLNRNTYPEWQELPEVYAEEGFDGNRDMYITSAGGVRFKVRVVTKRNGTIVVSGPRWTAFCLENLNEDVQLLHFVEEGDDSFYVTGYNRDGYEFGGYNIIAGRFSRFMSRVLPYLDVRQKIPAELLEGLGNAVRIRVQGNGINFRVNVRSVLVGGANGRRMYELDMEDWNTVEKNMDLEAGMYIIFTRKRADKLLVTGFSVHGHLTTDYRFNGASWLRMIQPPLQIWERDDDRMKHVCQWPLHRDHFFEEDTFYKNFADINDRQRLAIPAPFLENREFHTFTKVLMKHHDVEYVMRMTMDFHAENSARINHINVYGPWSEFARQVGFAYHKLIRFRFMYMVEYLDAGTNEQTQYLIFHICYVEGKKCWKESPNV